MLAQMLELSCKIHTGGYKSKQMNKKLAVLLGLLIVYPLGICKEKTVSLDGTEIFTPEHGSTQNLSADELAVMANYRLEEILRDENTTAEDIKLKGSKGKYTIYAGEKTILEINAEKLNLTDEKAEQKAKALLSNLRQEFGRLKERQFSISLLIKFLLAFIYPILLVLVLIGIRLLHRRILMSIYKMQERKITGLHLGKFQVMPLARLKLFLRILLTTLTTVSILISIYIFLAATFYYFPVTRKYAYEMYDFVGNLGSGIGLKFLKFIWRLAITLIILVFWFIFISAFDKYFDDASERRIKLPRFVKFEHLDIFEYIVKGIITLTALVMIVFILPGKGGQLGTALLAFIGLSLSLAFVGVFKNLAAGFLIAFSQSHNRGSTLITDGREAMILRTGVFFTSLRFARGDIKLIPNWQILSARIRVVPSGDVITWQGQIKLNKKTSLSDIQSDIEEWVSKWGRAQAKITAINLNLVDFEMTIPFIESSSEVFVSAAFDDLQKLLSPKNIEVSKLAVKS